jgi:hypothetical protein
MAGRMKAKTKRKTINKTKTTTRSETKTQKLKYNKNIKLERKLDNFRKSTPDHLLMDSAPNLGSLISRWEVRKLLIQK